MYHLYNNSEATDSQLKTTVPITSETFQYSLQHCTTIVHNNLSHTIPTSYNSLVFIFHHPLLNQTFSKSEGPCSNVRATVRPISRFETYNYGSWCLSRALRAGGVCNTKRSLTGCHRITRRIEGLQGTGEQWGVTFIMRGSSFLPAELRVKRSPSYLAYIAAEIC